MMKIVNNRQDPTWCRRGWMSVEMDVLISSLYWHWSSSLRRLLRRFDWGKESWGSGAAPTYASVEMSNGELRSIMSWFLFKVRWSSTDEFTISNVNDFPFLSPIYIPSLLFFSCSVLSLYLSMRFIPSR